jgi:hypothetical protein
MSEVQEGGRGCMGGGEGGAAHSRLRATQKKWEIGGFMLGSQLRHRMAGRVEGVAVYSRLHATQKMVRA